MPSRCPSPRSPGRAQPKDVVSPRSGLGPICCWDFGKSSEPIRNRCASPNRLIFRTQQFHTQTTDRPKLFVAAAIGCCALQRDPVGVTAMEGSCFRAAVCPTPSLTCAIHQVGSHSSCVRCPVNWRHHVAATAIHLTVKISLERSCPTDTWWTIWVAVIVLDFDHATMVELHSSKYGDTFHCFTSEK